MTADLTPTNASPFDAVRQVRADSSEFWTARDLMPLLGYDKWQNFERVIAEARHAAEIVGAADQFTDSGKKVPVGSGATRMVADVEMTRYGAYMVAMSCDGRKPEVAEAKTYFAIRTREAETASAFDPSQLTRQEILRIALNAEEERLALENENKALTPKAEAYDSFIDATGKYSVGAVAKMLGSSQNKLFRDLRNCGVFIAKGSMRNTPYQQYMRHFEVRAHEYERSNGEPGCSYTTYVQPSGIDFIRCKLSLPTIDPLPVEVGTAEANA